MKGWVAALVKFSLPLSEVSRVRPMVRLLQSPPSSGILLPNHCEISLSLSGPGQPPAASALHKCLVGKTVMHLGFPFHLSCNSWNYQKLCWLFSPPRSVLLRMSSQSYFIQDFAYIPRNENTANNLSLGSSFHFS